MDCYCLLFDGFESLDLTAPVSLLQRMPDMRLHYVSHQGGMVPSQQGFAIDTVPVWVPEPASTLLIPGGQGVRLLTEHQDFLYDLAIWAGQAQTCLSVSNGSALLAAAGCLDGVRATTDKRTFAWAQNLAANVHWQPFAAWVHDGKFYSASGMTAGMDMTLSFIADRYGKDLAETVAAQSEYVWQRHADAPAPRRVF
ncbi:DJ-1/PfpI family protein [Conchiformibius kuhniae]|uniref:DJ-1/PfpI family protein n=1 Tax=Conchiformibius kuhniae TaxID=211502 RepID=A0A8T9MVH7_9NEIS|nr:DJ-1/PfpI family protein [Conchiformibius kuhniae]UOP05124.1 DJ-1/PfpI family protein [Conchiformibius kuhniae]